MGKKYSSINQKIYRMNGCSKKTRKNYKGGTPDISLAYTGQYHPPLNNPFLAYTGKGGACNAHLTPSLQVPLNINAANKTIPNTGPIIGMPTAMSNQAGPQRGGNCGCSGIPVLSGGKSKNKKRGGSCGALCGLDYTAGGSVGGESHRIGCKCSSCKIKQTGGNPGLLYPAGLAGSPWTAQISGWPGVDGIQGDRNYSLLNTYPTDVQTAIVSPGSAPPFVVGGKNKNKNKNKNLISNKRFSRKQKGGTLSNFLSQDLINLGRQFQFGLGSAYNGLAGYASPVNPLPWKEQLPNTPSLSSVKSSYA